MRDSAGKRFARNYFYRRIIPSWLSTEQIRTNHVIGLLGKSPSELYLMDEAGFTRGHVNSLESDQSITEWQKTQGWGVKIHHGFLYDELPKIIKPEKTFCLFNLDVMGSYLSQTHSVMGEVLCSCLKNSGTVVATYSSVGRDTEMIWEGIRALAIFVLISPEDILPVFYSLSRRYERAGYTEPFHLALRDIFWLYSIMENGFVISATAEQSSPYGFQHWNAAVTKLWDFISIKCQAPLRLEDLLGFVEEFRSANLKLVQNLANHWVQQLLDISSLQRLVYKNETSLSQLCHFARFTVRQTPISAKWWLEKSCALMLSAPFSYITEEGAEHKIDETVTIIPKDRNIILWDDAGLYLRFRHKEVTQNKEMQMAIKTTRYIHENELTQEGIGKIKLLAKQHRDYTVKEILALLPKSLSENEKIRKSAAAHIAVARRKNN